MLQGIYIKQLNIGESFLGIIISLRTLVLALCSVPCAIFVNKYGKKKGLLIAMFFMPIFIAFQGYFENKWIILIFAVFQGAANSFISVSEGPFFMENSTEKIRLKLFSFSFADNVFSTMFGYFAFGTISNSLEKSLNITRALSYSIILSGALGVISCVFILMIKENKNSSLKTNQHFYKDMLHVLKGKYSVSLLVYNSIIGFGAGLVVPYFNVYLKYKINISTQQIGIIMALAQGAMGLGGLMTPFMAKKLGRINTVIICQIISIPFLMFIAIPPSVIVVSIALFIRNALMNMTSPITNTMSMELVNQNERSIFASANNIAGNVSRALSAVVAGFIMNNFANGYELPYFITAILYAIATIYFYKCFSPLNRQATQLVN